MTSGHSLTEAQALRWLVERIARTTGRPADGIDPHRPVHEFGLSSRDAVALSSDLGRLLDRSLPATLVWQNPTIAGLVSALFQGDPGEAAQVTRAVPGDPVAIVGIGCRLPGGVRSPAAFWDLLDSGREAIRDLPAGRWANFAPEETWADLPMRGGFLDDVAGFDATFFGIAPREAEAMDPQQRMLLEVTWEALDHAGIPADSLRGSRTGVFVGLSATEYGYLTMGDLDTVDAWTTTGAAASIAANRLSYLLDLRGPSVTLDTACSSSLVAVHQATLSLRRGESDLAVVGGSNLMLSPGVTANFHRAGVLAADGRCKAFDAAADGIVRGEGCGVVLLKRLTDARRAGDRVLAVITGTATNSDGRSNGLVAPNPEAQKALLREAYATAELDPSVVDYVEAHGTGTPLGDPIEANALGAVLGQRRAAERPLLIGSVKSNLGHLEGAAGVVGLIKVALAMGHDRIPPSLHVTEPSPHIDFAGNALRIAADATPWPRYSGLARAGVSAFGFGGSNAHIVVEEWPSPASKSTSDGQPHVIALSARTSSAVRRKAGELADWLGGDSSVRDVAAALAVRRQHLPARAAVVAADPDELADRLRALAEDRPSADTVTGLAGAPGVVFVFSGYGSQWPGMGRELLATEPAFQRAVAELDPVFQDQAGYSLRDALTDEAGWADLAVAQQVLFGMQVALANLWRAYGVEPAAVLGYSMGEIAAAVVCGALEVADGLRVMVARSRLLATVDATLAGKMAVVELSPSELDELAERFPNVSVAVYASPRQCTITGDAAEVDGIVSHVEGLGRLARTLRVGGAGHSAAVDPILNEFAARLEGLRPGVPGVEYYSTVLDGDEWAVGFDKYYWAANVRRPVRFTQALAKAMADGYRVFLEVAPHPVGKAAIEETAAGAGVDRVLAVPTLTRDGDPRTSLLAGVAALHVAGHPAVLSGLYRQAPVLDLPGPVWEHRPYWARGRARRSTVEHPLLGTPVETPGDDQLVWRREVGTETLPWLADHTVHGVAVLPGTGYLEMAISAARQAFGCAAHLIRVRDLEMRQVLPLARNTVVHVTLRATDRHSGTVEVYTKSAAGRWVRHATAYVCAESDVDIEGRPRLTEITPDTVGASSLDLYGALARIGQRYGPAFRGLRDVRVAPGRASAAIALPEEAPRNRHFALHPALADACLHTLIACAAGEQAAGSDLYLPMSIGSVRLPGDPSTGVRCDAVLEPADERRDGLVGAVSLVDGDGRVVVEITDVYVRRLARSSVPVPLADKCFEVRWERSELPPAAPGGRSWVLLAPDGGADEIATTLTDAGDQVVSIMDPAALASSGEHDGVLLVLGPSDQDPERVLLTATAVVRELAETTARPRLWLVTRDAVAVPDGALGTPELAALRGLVRVLAFEHPELLATQVDLNGSVDGLVAELSAGAADDEVAWRDGVRYVARLRRAEVVAGQRIPAVRDGAYAITGGLGGLGLVVAKWLAERGADRVVLCGRRAPSPETETLLDALRDGGTAVEVVLGDIAEPGMAEELVRVATAGNVPLRGVVHAAGVLADAATVTMSEDEVRRVWRPKVHGGLRLHEATRALDLDWWVVFSSAAALFGSPGQAAYASANAWLDALVAWRAGQGLPASTINWGAWSQVGGAADADNPVLRPLRPDEALEALEAVLVSGRAATGVTRLDVAGTLALFPELARRPMFAALAGELAEAPEDASGESRIEVAALKEMAPAAATRTIADRLIATLAGLTGLPADEIDPGAPLTRLGLDSLMAMRARTAFERDFGMAVPIPMLLRGASSTDIATFVSTSLGIGSGDAAVPPSGPQERDAIEARDATERWIARMWRKVLPADRSTVDTIGVHDDFFTVGGDAERARRLSTLIAERVGTEADLFAKPTIAAMADLLRPELEGGHGPVRVLCDPDREPDRPPLFLFHPAGGPTSVYQPLVGLLGDRQRCYGFERLDDVSTVEEKAARYIELLRDIQDTGPYRLAGWSFGGCLAYEVAAQLTERGERVDLVALIDSILPLRTPGESVAQSLLDRIGRFVDHVQRLYEVSLDISRETLARLSEDDQLRLVRDRLADRVPDMGDAVVQHQYTSYVDARVAERYQPGRYSGPVLLFRSTEPHPLTTSLDPRYLRTDDSLGWHEFCADLTVIRVPGDHLSMIDPPHVSLIAERLEQELARPPAGR
jgi:phthiocerol/phenolphthiocerol synthesis type-I polyketide synthase D